MLGLYCIRKFYEKDIEFSEPFAILCVSMRSIRQFLVKEAHEGGLMGYFGELKTSDVLNEHFF
ncbi:hypothetical protein CR513_22749, partial [Mucuna pruriens]